MQKTLVIGTLLGLAIASFVLFTVPQAVAAIAIAFAVVGVRTALNLRALKRLSSARRAFDAEGMHRELDRMLGRYGIDPQTRATLRFEKAIAHLMEEKYAEALELFRALEREPLSERNQHARLSNVAWCRLHLGDVPGAVTDAEAGLRGAEAFGDEAIAAQLGTLGAAYLAAGRVGEALGMLERALSLKVSAPQLRAIHQYYLGEARAAEGQTDAARAAWEQAAREGAGTPWGARAQAKLSG